MLLNWLFFGGIVAGSLLGRLGLVTLYWWPFDERILNQEIAFSSLLVLEIFFFNLLLSSFVLLTLSGMVFFLFAPVFLVIRVLLWGMLLNQLSTSFLLAMLPTLILEGEAYVISAVAGVTLGLSWLRPEWAFKGQNLSRKGAFRTAVTECVRMYILVIMLLLAGAVVETVTIAYALVGLQM
jgi:hypothetical protein